VGGGGGNKKENRVFSVGKQVPEKKRVVGRRGSFTLSKTTGVRKTNQRNKREKSHRKKTSGKGKEGKKSRLKKRVYWGRKKK